METGLVSFDSALSGISNAPLYQFEQSIFGFGYTNSVTGVSVVFPTTGPQSQMPYITSLHTTNSVTFFQTAAGATSVTVPGLILPTNLTAVATSGNAIRSW